MRIARTAPFMQGSESSSSSLTLSTKAQLKNCTNGDVTTMKRTTLDRIPFVGVLARLASNQESSPSSSADNEINKNGSADKGHSNYAIDVYHKNNGQQGNNMYNIHQKGGLLLFPSSSSSSSCHHHRENHEENNNTKSSSVVHGRDVQTVSDVFLPGFRDWLFQSPFDHHEIISHQPKQNHERSTAHLEKESVGSSATQLVPASRRASARGPGSTTGNEKILLSRHQQLPNCPKITGQEFRKNNNQHPQESTPRAFSQRKTHSQTQTATITTTNLTMPLRTSNHRIRTQSPHRHQQQNLTMSTADPTPRQRSRAIAIKRTRPSYLTTSDDIAVSPSNASNERLYDWATWRMYNRIIDHRRNHPMPRSSVPLSIPNTEQNAYNNQSQMSVGSLFPNNGSIDYIYDGEVFELEM